MRKLHCKITDSGFFTGFGFSIGQQSLLSYGVSLTIWERTLELGVDKDLFSFPKKGKKC